MTTLITPDRFVLDGSVTLAWLFQDELAEHIGGGVDQFPGATAVSESRQKPEARS